MYSSIIRNQFMQEPTEKPRNQPVWNKVGVYTPWHTSGENTQHNITCIIDYCYDIMGGEG